jgi:hypothetical protein
MKKVEANEDPTTAITGLIIAYIFPSNLVIIILHFIKIVKLRKSQALQKDVQKMNKVVSIILGVFVVYTFIENCTPNDSAIFTQYRWGAVFRFGHRHH